MANLTLIFSNVQPCREEKYPTTWLLYKNKDIVEIHVKHASQAHTEKVDSAQDASVVRMCKRTNRVIRHEEETAIIQRVATSTLADIYV
jgi:hypothetical protein